MSNLNLIDDYLANRMTDADRSAFESRLANEPDLNQEYSFHKEIVNSIQTERSMELKSMLNNIPVPTASQALGTSGKIAATVIAGAVIIGAIIYFADENEPAVTEKNDKIENVTKSNADNPVEDNTPAIEPEEETAAVEKVEQPKASETKETPKTTSRPTIKSPNLVDDFETEASSSDMEAPEVFTETANISAEELFDSNIEVIIDNSRKKYQFHYQFKGEKLYLFGDFSSGLYEILELNSQEMTTVILYFKEGYYLLDVNQNEITNLKAIEDVSMIEKLNSLRQK